MTVLTMKIPGTKIDLREDKEALQALAENGHSPMKREQVSLAGFCMKIDCHGEKSFSNKSPAASLFFMICCQLIKILLPGSETGKQDPGGEVPRVFRSHTKGTQTG